MPPYVPFGQIFSANPSTFSHLEDNLLPDHTRRLSARRSPVVTLLDSSLRGDPSSISGPGSWQRPREESVSNRQRKAPPVWLLIAGKRGKTRGPRYGPGSSVGLIIEIGLIMTVFNYSDFTWGRRKLFVHRAQLANWVSSSPADGCSHAMCWLPAGWPGGSGKNNASLSQPPLNANMREIER